MDNSKTTTAQIRDKLGKATGQITDDDFDGAIASLKAILAIDPEHEISLDLLGSIFLQIDRPNEAIDAYETLLQVNPKNTQARFQLGLARFLSGSAEQAIDTWAPMLGQEDEYMANFHSAVAFLQLDRPREAVELLDVARQNMPSSHPLYTQVIDLHEELIRHGLDQQ